jgi:hypothetical protein
MTATTLDRVLENFDLVLFLAIIALLAAYSAFSEVKGKTVNYNRITAYAVMSIAFLPGVHWLRASLRGYANVGAFMSELNSLAQNQFATTTLKQWRNELESFTRGQLVASTTADAVEGLARAFESAPSGMQVTVINPAPLLSLPQASVLRDAELTAIQRGVSVLHIIVDPSPSVARSGGILAPSGGPSLGGPRSLHITYAKASNLSAFRMYGSGTVFSFGDEWYAQVDVLRTGGGESIRALFSWGSDSHTLGDMVAEVTRLAAGG